jgi:hypothetical protein
MGQTVRFQETLRRLAMTGETFVKDQAGLELGLGLAGVSALDPKTTALLQVGSPTVCLEWSTGLALTAGASEDEIAGVPTRSRSSAGTAETTQAWSTPKSHPGFS